MTNPLDPQLDRPDAQRAREILRAIREPFEVSTRADGSILIEHRGMEALNILDRLTLGLAIEVALKEFARR